jgi:hypothetical protein
MLDTFIKNKGITKTIIHNKNQNYYNEVNWDADYDGEKAKISLDIDDNGSKNHMEMEMDNNELAEILNIPSVNKTLDKRLYNDFLSKRRSHAHTFAPTDFDTDKIIKVYLQPKSNYKKKRVHFGPDILPQNEIENEIENEIQSDSSSDASTNPTKEDFYTHISSPAPQEELIFPLTPLTTINKNRHIHSHKNKRHNKLKTHITYKVYRKSKSSPTSSKASRRSTTSRSSTRKMREGSSKHKTYSRHTF